MKKMLVVGLATAVGAVIVAGVIARHSPRLFSKNDDATPPQVTESKPAPVAQVPQEAPLAPPEEPPPAAPADAGPPAASTEPAAPQPVAPPPREVRAPGPGVAPGAKPKSKGPKPPPAAPEAREALGLVGTDRKAEEVWVRAINDPNLSAGERRNLIEDLNEDGFPDPKNITKEDLPLILRRMELIEHLAPDALDDANAAAFAEAYKDLVKMAERVTAQ